jgi:hypothetical protein
LKYFIISVDGGGIRGVIPAMLLRSIGQETIIKANLFAGTSTGSLIAVGLAADVKIEKITDTYLDPKACHTIFTPYMGSPEQSDPAGHLSLLQKLRGLLVKEDLHLLQSGIGSVFEELLFPQYTAAGLRRVIESCAPETTLGKLKHHVFVPTFVLNAITAAGPQWEATAFHNLPGPVGFGGHAAAPLVDAIMASAAAPLYFPPHPYDGMLFVDGGLMAQNPTMLALATAIGAGLVGERGVPLEEVSILSLGTGSNASSYPPAGVDFPPPYGMLGWSWPEPRGTSTPAVPLTDAILDGVAQVTDYQVQALIGKDNYRRAQVGLGTTTIALNDCAMVHASGGLEDLANRYIETSYWQDTIQWVKDRLG